ncbi:hypothetical protein SDC9_206744 [bioreactor metagenome]|uniref:Uncharacterized protein n=1 Tax=bioreactor metagenome TaxID=1076179 RepID=A0A645J6E4_9ZZZZ
MAVIRPGLQAPFAGGVGKQRDATPAVGSADLARRLAAGGVEFVGLEGEGLAVCVMQRDHRRARPANVEPDFVSACRRCGE